MKCIRLYNEQGEHIATLLPCLDGDGYDLANPDGKVLRCGLPESLWEAMAYVFPVENL